MLIHMKILRKDVRGSRIAVGVALEGSKCILVAAGFLLFRSIKDPFLPFFSEQKVQISKYTFFSPLMA